MSALGKVLVDAAKMPFLSQHIKERLSQHRENVGLWKSGALNPTEPDEAERRAVVRELNAAIYELEKIERMIEFKG